jgi:PAS domain S-box-containing protein
MDPVELLRNTTELFRREPGLLERLLDTVGDALFVVDAQRNIVFWNKQAEALTGYTAQEVVGKVCLSGINCERCRYSCLVFQDGEVRNTSVTLRTKSGEELVCTKDAFVLKDKSGGIIGAVEFLHNKTDLVRQIETTRSRNQRLRSRERLQSAVLSSINEGVITISKDKRITSFSRKAEMITGRKAESVIGRRCDEVLGSSLCDSACPMEHCFQTEDGEAERLTEIKTASGVTIPIVSVAVPLKDERGRIIGSVLVIEDRSNPMRLPVGGIGCCGMIGRSEAMQRVFRVIEQVARTDTTVLVTGESGTGKEMVARAIHISSNRSKGPFEAVNCAALPETLLESELFGHVRGAFTGATRDRSGRVEEAEGGTLFLDEIGEMPLSLQAKLLRFLQAHEYQRVGESSTRTADVRIVAATNRDLESCVESGAFRQDLYYRIKVIPIQVPALRDRREDIPLLAVNLLGEITRLVNRPGLTLTNAALEKLGCYDWPGNVRELVNALQYAATLASRRRIRAVDLPEEIKGKTKPRYRTRTSPVEISLIQEALLRANGNRSAAARALGMNRVTLYRKMKQYGIA